MHQFTIQTRIFYLRLETARSVTRRIFKKIREHEAGTHEAHHRRATAHTRPLQPVRLHFMATPTHAPTSTHTSARESPSSRVRTHTFDLVCKTHGGGICLETELFFDEISSRSMDIIVCTLSFFLFRCERIFVFLFFERERERDVTLDSRNFSRGLSNK